MKFLRKLKIFTLNICAMIYLYFYKKFNEWLWKSKRGAALFHAIFDQYTSTIMFTERVKYFGRAEAAKLFSYSEFCHFKHKLINNDLFYTKLLFCPNKIIEELGEKDLYLKKLVKFI